MGTRSQRTLIVGIGNPDRGDDAAGRMVARGLLNRPFPDVTVMEHGGEALSLLDLMENTVDIYIVDACVSGAPTGTVQRFDVTDRPLPGGRFGVSTHGFDLAGTIELARTLGRLPTRLVVYAIEGKTFDPGAPLSPAVADAVREVTSRLRVELARATRREG